MKGRGVRTIDGSDLRIVTPDDATAKDHFVIVDAVGVTEVDLNDTVPLERSHNIGFDKLLNLIGLGSTNEAVVSSVASRLARLDKRITHSDRVEVEAVAGVSLTSLAARLVDALDPSRHPRRCPRGHRCRGTHRRADRRRPRPASVTEALQPIAANPQLREKLVEIRRSYEQVIDAASADRLIAGEFSADATDRARRVTASFAQYIEDNKDEITALQVLYSQPYRGGLTFADIRELANAIKRPPRRWTPEELWGRLRNSRRHQSPGVGSARQHRPRQPRPLRPRQRRRTRRLPRPRERTIRRLAAPTGQHRPRLRRGADRVPPSDQGPHSRQPVHRAT